MEIAFNVPGIPQAQKRHRTYTKGKGGVPLSFARQVDPSATDKANFLAQVRGHTPPTPLAGPLRLWIVFNFPRPQSHYRTGSHAHELRADRPAYHDRKPDFDNLAKLVCDALNGVFFKDDSQIARVSIDKVYTDGMPSTDIILSDEA